MRKLRPVVFTVLILTADAAVAAHASTGVPGGLGMSLDPGQTLSRQVPLYAGGGGTHDTAISVDGAALAVTPTSSPPAVVTFQGSGIQSGSQRLLNLVWVNGQLVTLIDQDVSNFATSTIPIPAGFLRPGANILRIRSGDSISPTDLVGNHDDFSIRDVNLILPNNTTLTDPTVPSTKTISLGDGFPGGNATEQQVTADFTMTADADQLDGVTATWDTTSFPDGPHTVTATGAHADGSAATVSAQVVTDNTPPQLTITSPTAADHEGVNLPVTVDAVDATSQVVSTAGVLDGIAIPVPDTFPSDNLAPGTHTLAVTAVDSSGNSATATRSFSTSIGAVPAYDRGQVGRPPYAGPDTPTLVAAGDVACSPGSNPTPVTCHQAGTAALAQSLAPDVVAALGDEQYDVGTLDNFTRSYDLTWGQFKDITYPVIGNHEYAQANYPGAQALGYFDYFNGVGTADGRAADRDRGYYSYDIGAWHVVVLNADCGVVSCVHGSGQQVWLDRDLAAHHNRCTMAMWHQPLFTAGTTENDGNGLATRPLWDTLYARGADVILNGHDHNYQRFAPQDPGGKPDQTRGIREFVVGTGGDSHFALSDRDRFPNLQAGDDNSFGVLQLHLAPDSYTWRFVTEPGGGTFTDSGTSICH